MTREELIVNLEYLIKKYIASEAKRYEMLEDISRRDFYIAKGILSEISKSATRIEKDDADLIKEIAFNFS